MGTSTGLLEIYSIKGKQRIGILQGHIVQIKKIVILSKFNTVISIDIDSNILLFCLIKKKIINEIRLNKIEPIDVDVNQNTGDIFVCSTKCILVYDINCNLLIKQFFLYTTFTCIFSINSSDYYDTPAIITGQDDGMIIVWFFKVIEKKISQENKCVYNDMRKLIMNYSISISKKPIRSIIYSESQLLIIDSNNVYRKLN